MGDLATDVSISYIEYRTYLRLQSSGSSLNQNYAQINFNGAQFNPLVANGIVIAFWVKFNQLEVGPLFDFTDQTGTMLAHFWIYPQINILLYIAIKINKISI